MNPSKKLTTSFLFYSSALAVSLALLSGCVTTRSQMNKDSREGSMSDDGSPANDKVMSQDLNQPASRASKVPNTAEPETSVPESNVSDSKSGIPQPVRKTYTPAPSETSSSSSVPSTAPAVPPSTVVAAGGAAGVAAAETGSYGIDELRAEMARLNGRVEELEHEKQNQTQASAEEQKKLQTKIDDLEKQSQAKAAEVAAANAGPVVPEGESAFEAGKDAYFAQKYDDAIPLLDEALKKSDKGKDAEEATYIKGESYFKTKQYKKAIVDFSKFPEKYPKSAYHPKALLRIAECFEALGMKEDSRTFYADLLDKFPKTAEGKLAKKRLAKK
jgi:TolA-binding protein